MKNDSFFNTGLSQQQFLEQYWQKKPLLIRQAFPNFISPITVEELAGIACEEEVESRLIEEFSDEGPWRLRHGPFESTDFEQLPSTHWTLLVQDMDKHVPELKAVVKPFEFIPDWRRDDLMISFAPKHGSVGPHTDGYDVFLIQAQGTRRWQISAEPILDVDYVAGLDLKILPDFEVAETWDLQEGDILYLPPHYAHHGVALNDCMTFSVGFRAPKQVELLDAFIQTLVDHDKGQKHYSDPMLRLRESSTEIDSAAKQRFKTLLVELINESDDLLTEAIGRLLTETKPSLELHAEDVISEQLEEETSILFTQGHHLRRNRYLRFAWSETEAGLHLFVAGEMFTVDKRIKPFMPLLTENEVLSAEEWQLLSQYEDMRQLFNSLIELGGWYWAD